MPSPSFSISGTGLMTSRGTGTCTVALTRTFREEIKQDKSFQTDPLVAANSDNGTKTSYAATVTSCDNHNNATYYGRSFFTSATTYHDSGHIKAQVC